MGSKLLCDARQYTLMLEDVYKEKGYIYAHKTTGECVVFHDKVKAPEKHADYYPLTLRDIVSLGNQLKQEILNLKLTDKTVPEALKLMGVNKAAKEGPLKLSITTLCALYERILNFANLLLFNTTSQLTLDLAETLSVKNSIQIGFTAAPVHTTAAENHVQPASIILDVEPFTMELKETKDRISALETYKSGSSCKLVQYRLLFTELKMGTIVEPETGKVDTVIRLLQYVSGLKKIDLRNAVLERVILDVFNRTNSSLQIEFIDWMGKEGTFNPGLFISLINNYLAKEQAGSMLDSDYVNIVKLLGCFDKCHWYTPKEDYQKALMPYKHPSVIDAILLILKIDRNALTYQTITTFVDKVIYNGQSENFEPALLASEDKFDYETFKQLMGPYVNLSSNVVNTIHSNLLAAFKKNKWKHQLRSDTSQEAKKILYHIYPAEAPQLPLISSVPKPAPRPLSHAQTLPSFPTQSLPAATNSVLARLQRQSSEKSLGNLETYKTNPASLDARAKKNLWNGIVKFEAPQDYKDPQITYLTQIMPFGSDLSSENTALIVKDAFRMIPSEILSILSEKITQLTGKVYYHHLHSNLLADLLQIATNEGLHPMTIRASTIMNLLKFYKHQYMDLPIPLDDVRVKEAIKYLISNDPESTRYKVNECMEWSIQKEGENITYVLEYDTFKLWLETFAETCLVSKRAHFTNAESTLICLCRDHKPEYIQRLEVDDPDLYKYISKLLNK